MKINIDSFMMIAVGIAMLSVAAMALTMVYLALTGQIVITS